MVVSKLFVLSRMTYLAIRGRSTSTQSGVGCYRLSGWTCFGSEFKAYAYKKSGSICLPKKEVSGGVAKRAADISSYWDGCTVATSNDSVNDVQ